MNRREFVAEVMSSAVVISSYPLLAQASVIQQSSNFPRYTEKDLLPLEMPQGVPGAGIYNGLREIRQYVINSEGDSFVIRWDILTQQGQYFLLINQPYPSEPDPMSQERVQLRELARKKLYHKAGISLS